MNFIAPEISDLNLEHFMNSALEEAKLAGRAGEIPIGAIVVIDNQVISSGRARHKEIKSQLSHAELNAMLAGGELLWRDYQKAILFTTVEPCPMCLGATVMADIPHIVFALHDNIGQSSLSIETNPYINRHIKTYYGGVLEDRSIELFKKYAPDDLEYILRFQK
jgi:tRNA(Arg) A34 adenosine deaminase TadA